MKPEHLNIPPEIRRRIALRKFIAVPLSILLGTAGSVAAAHYVMVQLLQTPSAYAMSILLGLFMSSTLAYGFKALLKMRGQFKMDYVIASMSAVIVIVSTLSFLLHVLILSSAYR